MGNHSGPIAKLHPGQDGSQHCASVELTARFRSGLGGVVGKSHAQPPVEDPADRERDRNDAYLQRKAQERERGFQQQHQQAEERRQAMDRWMQQDDKTRPGRSEK
jgi:hypothetical protein